MGVSLFWEIDNLDAFFDGLEGSFLSLLRAAVSREVQTAVREIITGREYGNALYYLSLQDGKAGFVVNIPDGNGEIRQFISLEELIASNLDLYAADQDPKSSKYHSEDVSDAAAFSAQLKAAAATLDEFVERASTSGTYEDDGDTSA